MSKKDAFMFFITFFVVWILVSPAVEVLLGDEENYLDGFKFSLFVGSFVGSAVAGVVMYVMKNRSQSSE